MELHLDPALAHAVDHLEHLAVMAGRGQVHFSAGGTRASADLQALFATAAPTAAPAPQTAPPRFPEAVAAFEDFIAQLTEDLLHLAVVRTPGEDGPPALATWIRWGGTTTSLVRADAPRAASTAHDRTTRGALRDRARRLRLLLATLTAASRVAARLSLPGGTLLALPVLYGYLREAAAQAPTPSPEPPEIPWPTPSSRTPSRAPRTPSPATSRTPPR